MAEAPALLARLAHNFGMKSMHETPAPLPQEDFDRPEVTTASLGIPPVRHERFAERIYESLFHSIVTGRFPEGSRLPPELELAEHFKVSRPVVRQALDRLRKDRLVESVRGSGTFVRTLEHASARISASSLADLSHIQHGIELRLVLEPEIAALAAMRRKSKDLSMMKSMLDAYGEAAVRGHVAYHYDFGFHEAVAQASANPRLLAMFRTLEYDVGHSINLWRHLAHKAPWTRTQDVEDEHINIMKLIEGQDAEGARRAMRGHIENARVRMFGGT